MLRANLVFEQWQQRLELDADLWGARLFAADGGLIWRNAAARKFYETRGFFSAPTMRWELVKTYLSREELANLEQIYAEAFRTGRAVDYTHTSQAAGHPPSVTRTRFKAVFGNMQSGVLITHLQPLAVSVGEVPVTPFQGLAQAASAISSGSVSCSSI